MAAALELGGGMIQKYHLWWIKLLINCNASETKISDSDPLGLEVCKDDLLVR